MIWPLWRNHRIFYQTVYTPARFHILARVAHLNDWMTYGEPEILANIRIQTHNFDILENPIFACLIA